MEPTDLSELHEALFDLIEKASRGMDVAWHAPVWGAKEFVIHHNTDSWGDAVPVEVSVLASDLSAEIGFPCITGIIMTTRATGHLLKSAVIPS